MSPLRNIVYPNNSFNNGLRALLERQFFVKNYLGLLVEPTNPVPRFFNASLERAYHALKPRDFRPRMTYTEYVKSSPKPRLYERVRETLLMKPVTIKDSHIKFFVKCEATDLTAKPDAVPRAICPRDPRYVLSLGCYVKAIEKTIYASLNEMWGDTVVAKGLNAVQRAEVIVRAWESFKDPVAIGCDATRFDQHISRSALEWEHSIYRRYFPNDTHLTKLLRWQLTNRVTGQFPDGRFKATINGHRMSGDPNTALGNTLIMSSMCYEYAYARGLEDKVKFINDGDDSVFFMERRDITLFYEGFNEFFLDLGFRMELEPLVDVLEKVEFCQAQPVWNGECYIMARSHHKARVKDCYSSKVRSERDWRMWNGAVSMGGLSLSAGVPVMQSFYSSIGRSGMLGGKLEKWSGLEHLSRGISQRKRPVSDYSRYSYWLAFGTTPAEQILLESYYDDFTPLWCDGQFPTDNSMTPADPYPPLSAVWVW